MELDHKDHKLIALLQANGRMSNTELAQEIELSPPGLQKRLRKLEENGVIEGYFARISREALGFDMLCFVQVTLTRHESGAVENFRQVVQQMPEVLECHHITGESDYLLKIVVRNRKHLERFLMESLTPIRGMDRHRTSLVLIEIKETLKLPVGHPTP